MGALRKILSGLVFSKRRNTEHAIWDKSELLFICSLKYEDNLVLGFVNFKDSNSAIPSINTFYWDVNKETNLNFKSKLESLVWPSDMSKTDEWKRSWSSAFTTVYRENIVQSRQLVERLAKLAQNTRQRVLETYLVENANGELHKLFKKFQELLIHDLSKEDFADMYAQTVAYGLFSARCMDTDGHFELDEVVERIPTTNPFLKQLLKNCFEHGLGSSTSLMFDELAIGEIVDLLDHIDTDKILDDFGRQTGGGSEDPVIHFYEGFLDAYEHEQKKRRGVYYTPDPVVDFIVRSVDEILREEFSYADGLADISHKIIEYQRESKKQKLGAQTKYVTDTKEVPAIQILDPATGTGTFLAHTIRMIKATFDHKHQGKSAAEIKELWNQYVPQHLLPRINGFEIMMAPYSVAHMKLGLVLKETGYDFRDNDRLNVYLTNTLEKAGSEEITLFDLLSEEAAGANKIKNDKGINVIIGNPPYSGLSQNMNPWIDGLLRGTLEDGSKVQSYYEINGGTLGEKKLWLQDDYVKFFRYAHNYIDSCKDGGILAFISNHGYLDNPTFRGMRESLLETFDDIYILDLHGNVMKKESCPDGNKDENVFDIQQGVCIGIFVKCCNHSNRKDNTTKLYHVDIWGSREYKYDYLRNTSFLKINWNNICPTLPWYWFVPRNSDFEDEYINNWRIDNIMPLNSTGIITSRDSFVIDSSEESLLARIAQFHDIVNFSDSDIEDRFKLSENYAWSLSEARKEFSKVKDWSNYIKDILYRPFDKRKILYHPSLVWRTREKVMVNMDKGNIGLIFMRQVALNQEYSHFLVTENLIDNRSFYSNKGIVILAPLYLMPDRVPNINSQFIAQFSLLLEIDIEPEEILYYIYAVFHSIIYRNRYAEFLKIDFPRIPLTSNLKLFRELCGIGKKLVDLHLMKVNLVPISEFFISGRNNVEKFSYQLYPNDLDNVITTQSGRIYINNTQYFKGVPDKVWSFNIGGYQVCHKWLKERKGSVLSQNDIEQYQQIIAILSETITLMDKIDEVIEEHGGWPLA